MKPQTWGYFEGIKPVAFWGWVRDEEVNPVGGRLRRQRSLELLIKDEELLLLAGQIFINIIRRH